ncbi:D-alanyl-D-alanine carboxypeptidase family protein [Chlamydiifrater phoenicopteri]|uniref:D-alanyl-D-alanine carboxypeptidase family protein n=1 Tax=Chlamydiifrater phoenicopteri TaxID=2681469 RepID=UPI001BCFD1E7|nr:D-alanyl-D-alanine carboxypeptidase [Chlamydiifrater phoenicopteri]
MNSLLLKKSLFYVVFFFASQSFFLSATLDSVINSSLKLSGENLLLINASDGRILYEKNSENTIYPASMTKIATALFILVRYPEILEKYITIKKDYLSTITPEVKKDSGYRSPPYWLESDGSNMGLKVREEVLGKELFFSLLVCSANDAANALAGACAGSIPKFMEELNAFLKHIGCSSTHFNNPHGLHHPDHFTTTRDLALIFRYALRHPLFREAITTTRYKSLETNLEASRVFQQTNKMILPSSQFYYEYAVGGKTGSTRCAGKNLICAAKNHRREVIVVASGYHKSVTTLYEDVRALFETALNEPHQKEFLLPPGTSFPISFNNSWKKIKAPLPEGVYYNYFPSEGKKRASVIFQQKLKKLPIAKGVCLGEFQVIDTSGHILSSFPVFTQKRITQNLLSMLSVFVMKKFVPAFFVVYTSFFLWKKRSRRRARSIFL